MYPRKLYVEVSTRCNMNCGMCVKYAPGNDISNIDFDSTLFTNLTCVFSELDALVLNGIGEPLLHPDLIKMITAARKLMKPDGWIGFQSNGALLTRPIIEKLLKAGLGKLCVSVDSPTELTDTGTLVHRHAGGSSPIALVRSVAEKHSTADFKLGAEVVLTRDTVSSLPKLVQSLAEDGVDFIIGSHLLAYQPSQQSQSLFTPVPLEAQQLFQKWQKKASKEGLELSNLTAKTWIAPRKKEEHRLQQLYRAMLQEAQAESIWLDVRKLNALDRDQIEQWQKYLDEAQAVAEEKGIDISLPLLYPTTERSCRFMEEGSVFVDVHGDVTPCHPLWHSHTVFTDDEAKHIKKRTFGSIRDQQLSDIWQSEPYIAFRKAALGYDYPFCHSCSLGPCSDITGENEPFINDCFGTEVPCGHCLWCYDAIRCL